MLIRIKNRFQYTPVFFLTIVLSLNGCAINYLVDKLDMTDRFRESKANVLNTGELSSETVQELRILALEETFEEDPVKALTAMEAHSVKGRDAEQALALAESAFYYGNNLYKRGKRVESAKYYLMAAAHSYDFLFYSNDKLAHSFVSPFGRYATELYNSSLSRIIDIRETEHTSWQLPWECQVGNTIYKFSRDPNVDKQFPPHSFQEYLPAYEIRARSLKNEYSSRGIGAPLVGKRKNPPSSPDYDPFAPPSISAPVTVLFHFAERPTVNVEPTVETPQVREVTVSVLDPFRLDSVSIKGATYPIEADYSASFGVLLQEVRPGQAVLDALLNAGNHVDRIKLTFLQPYDATKIPVVLVHGLYSSPATYIQMLNDLMGVEEIRRKYQFWVFGYPTGLPIIETSTRLRAALRAAAQKFDPDGTSPTFNQMVMVGHSMGGILTRTMVVENSRNVWDAFFTVPIEKLNLTDDERAYVREIGEFEALPFVRRAVLIAAPLRGSSVAQRSIVTRLTRWLISVPAAFVTRRQSLLTKNRAFLNPSLANDEFITVARTSVDNLRPDSQVLKAFIDTPIAAGVTCNTIIGVEDATTGPGSSDGVVEYSSSHVEGAESEALVHSGHVCLEHPDTITEVRRILLHHLGAALGDATNTTLPTKP